MWWPATTKVAVFALVCLSTAFPSSCERRLALSGNTFIELNKTLASSIETERLQTSLDQPPASSSETPAELNPPPPSVEKRSGDPCLCAVGKATEAACQKGDDVTYISLYGKKLNAIVEKVHRVEDFTQRGYTLSFPGIEKGNKRVRCFKVRKRMEPNELLPNAFPEEKWPVWPTRTNRHEAKSQILKEGSLESSSASKFWGGDSFILANLLNGTAANSMTGWYRDTTFRFPCEGEKCHEDGKKLVALTLHDGLMGHYDDHGAALSIVKFLRELLKRHDAKATIFLIGEYFMPHLKKTTKKDDEGNNKADAAQLAFEGFLEDGHEFGNHNEKDAFYALYNKEDFRNDLTDVQVGIESLTSAFEDRKKKKKKQTAPQTEARIDQAISPHVQPTKMIQSTTGKIVQSTTKKIKWYSPPKAVMSWAMRDVLSDEGFRTVIGSAYAEDWSIQNSEFIAQTLLQQANTAGSIIILHLPRLSVPEAKPNQVEDQVEAKWWWTLHALEKLLIYLKENGFATTTLSDLEKRSSA